MNDTDWLDVYNAIIASFLSVIRPKDQLAFRRLVTQQGQLGGVTDVCFLLYRTIDETAPCVHHFLFRSVPNLLQHLSRSIQPQRVIMHDHTRGRVDWSSTYKVRYSEDHNSSVFVCFPGGRHFDRPENQLLLFLLHRIQACIERVPLSLMNWNAWGQHSAD